MRRHLIAIFLLAISITFVVGAQEKQLEVTEEDALAAISQAELDIREMSERGFGVVYVNDRLIEARNALLVGGKTNYALVLVKAEEISKRKDRAYGIRDSLRALKLRIEELSGRGLDTAKAGEIYIAASDAFRKENYDEAEELVFQANKNLSDVEAEYTVFRARYNAARDNTISYLKEHWRGISMALALLLVIGLISYDKFESMKTRRRLDDMEIEKKVLVEQMKKAQIDYFNKGLMSRESYDIKMRKYREMMVKIEEGIPVLRTRLEKRPKIGEILKLKRRWRG
ncbi:MAG: hypothetical protein ACE5PM_05945 [Candidatus Hydrothermarchaeales archaeon]